MKRTLATSVSLTLIVIAMLLAGCTTTKKLTFQEYKFEIKGFDWDPNPYKFSTYIQDSVVANNGAQFAAWDFSYIGDIGKMLSTWDLRAQARGALSTAEIEEFKQLERKNAKRVILDKAKEHRVVIINEAHQMPQHRVFTSELLQELYNQGYRHFGLETFFSSPKSDSSLLANKYPILTNGYYIKEPQFGNLVRQAVKIGFQVFGYESEGHVDSKGREINQAKNIQKYLEENPNSKYLIHCGFAHATEGHYGGTWEKAMASRLTEYTGIDPLTINQTTYSEKSKKAFEDPYYQITDVTEPSVFVRNDSIFGQSRAGTWFDIFVFHPRTKNFNRPEWLLTGNREIYPFDFNAATIDGPYLVFAYKKGEEIGSAIPYDIQETNEKMVNLVLDEATYDIVIVNTAGQALKTAIKNE